MKFEQIENAVINGDLESITEESLIGVDAGKLNNLLNSVANKEKIETLRHLIGVIPQQNLNEALKGLISQLAHLEGNNEILQLLVDSAPADSVGNVLMIASISSIYAGRLDNLKFLTSIDLGDKNFHKNLIVGLHKLALSLGAVNIIEYLDAKLEID